MVAKTLSPPFLPLHPEDPGTQKKLGALLTSPLLLPSLGEERGQRGGAAALSTPRGSHPLWAVGTGEPSSQPWAASWGLSKPPPLQDQVPHHTGSVDSSKGAGKKDSPQTPYGGPQPRANAGCVDTSDRPGPAPLLRRLLGRFLKRTPHTPPHKPPLPRQGALRPLPCVLPTCVLFDQHRNIKRPLFTGPCVCHQGEGGQGRESARTALDSRGWGVVVVEGRVPPTVGASEGALPALAGASLCPGHRHIHGPGLRVPLCSPPPPAPPAAPHSSFGIPGYLPSNPVSIISVFSKRRNSFGLKAKFLPRVFSRE